MQRAADNHVILLYAEFHHFDLPFGERLDIVGEGEAKQTADFQRCRALRVNGVVDGRFPLQEGQTLVIFRVADTGNCVACAQPLRNQAAEHVRFVTGGGRNDEIRLFYAGIQQCACVRSVAADAQHIQRILAPLQNVLVLVDNHNVVSLAGQLLRNRMTDFAVPDDQYAHNP